MADADYRSWVEVLPDFKNFNSTVENAVVGGMASAGTSGSAAMGGSLIAGIGKFAGPIALAIGALGIAGALTDAISTGVDAGIAYISQSVTQGSDYNESLNAISVAYGDFVDDINKIAETSATDLGLSQLDFNAIATQFSSFAKTIRSEDPASFIEELSTRGADFASVYNIEVSEALRLFQSGLAGETEPLRRFGIDLSAATVKGYAYANGIAEQGKELTEAQRQQAAYLALLDQTSITQGDFANTSDQLANRQRILNAQWEDAQAQLGLQLLPVLQDVLSFVSDELMPIFLDFNEELGPELRAALEDAFPALKELVDLILPLIPPALEAIIEGINSVSESFQVFAAFANLIAGTFSDFFALLAGDVSIQQFVDNFLARLNEWLGAVGERVGSVASIFGDLGSSILNQLGKIGTNLFEGGRALVSNFINGISSMFGDVGKVVGDLMEFVAGFFPNSPAKHGPLSGSGWSALGKSGAAIMSQFESGLVPVDVPLSVTAPRASDVSRDLSTSALSGLRSETTLNLNGVDPAAVYQLMRQDLGSKLVGI